MIHEPTHDAPPDGWPRPWAVRAAAAAAAVIGVAVLWPAREAPPAPPPPAADEADDEPLPIPANPGYLGPKACAPCHADRVAEFLTTPHARSCRVPDPAAMPPGFAPGRGTVPTAYPGLRFEMTRDGDAFSQTAVRTTPAGETRARQQIALVYGGGHLDEVNFAWDGDHLYELPVAWLYPLDQWGVTTSYRYEDNRTVAREATTRC